MAQVLLLEERFCPCNQYYYSTGPENISLRFHDLSRSLSLSQKKKNYEKKKEVGRKEDEVGSERVWVFGGGAGGKNGERREIHTIFLRRTQVCRIRLVRLLIHQWNKGNIRRIYMFCVRRWQIERQRTNLYCYFKMEGRRKGLRS